MTLLQTPISLAATDILFDLRADSGSANASQFRTAESSYGSGLVEKVRALIDARRMQTMTYFRAALLASLCSAAMSGPANGSALNVLQTSNAIHFYTDGGVYGGPQLALRDTMQKIHIMPAARAVIAVTGPQMLLQLGRPFVDRSLSIEEVLRRTYEMIDTLMPMMIEPGAYGGIGSTYTVVVGGFDARCERQVWELKGKLGEPAGKFERFGSSESVYAPWVTPEQISAVHGGKEGRLIVESQARGDFLGDPDRYGLEILEVQRRLTVAGAHVVGLFAQATKVTCDKIETKIIRRWPDKIGQRVEPQP